MGFRLELGEWCKIPTTYAGGARSEDSRSFPLLVDLVPRWLTRSWSNLGVQDLDLVDRLSGGKVDLTFGRQV